MGRTLGRAVGVAVGLLVGVLLGRGETEVGSGVATGTTSGMAVRGWSVAGMSVQRKVSSTASAPRPARYPRLNFLFMCSPQA